MTTAVGINPERCHARGREPGGREGLQVRLASVQVGDLVLYNVEATLSERHELPITLLGMSFLGQVEMQCGGTTLTLTRRH